MTSFERMISLARSHGPEVIHRMMEIVRGQSTSSVVVIEDGEPVEKPVPVKDADRIAAAKLIAGMILNKDAQQVKGEDALENLNPYEKLRVLREATEQVEKEIVDLQ